MPDQPTPTTLPSSDVIYLDNHATTCVDPQVVEAMLPWMTQEYGNAGSIGHPFGEAAREAVDRSRATIATAIGADPSEIVFTSGATESNNLAIRGVAERNRRRGDHVVSVVTEHHAVLGPLQRLAKRRHDVTMLGVKQRGRPDAGVVDLGEVERAITDQTCLVSVMLANNEIGAVQPIAEISKVCREHGVLLHSDATQAIGKMSVDVQQLGVDLMSFTAHKLYGPKGIGALYVRGRDPIVRLEAQITGGGQERGRRSGTANVPGIVGMAKAVELCQQEAPYQAIRIAGLRDELFAKLSESIPDLELCGPGLEERSTAGEALRLAGNLNVHVPGVDGEAIMLHTPGVAMSSGAACSSADPEPSHVLQALGYSADEARCSLRLGLGRFNDSGQVESAAEQIARAIEKLLP